MRSLFLFLSRNRRLRNWMETSSTARRLSSRFVAGETLDQALEAAARVKGEGISVTLDHLGENVTTAEEALQSGSECVLAVSRMRQAGIEPNVSIKLSQFGIDIDERICRDNVERLVQAAVAHDGFVRVDMESSEYTARTIGLVADLYARYGHTGAVIQAYLFRSDKDIDLLCEKKIRVRLCKGAYLEPPEISFEKKDDVDANFLRLMKKLLETGVYPAIASHDETIITETVRFAREKGIGPDGFEFEMLYGIRRDLQRRLVSDGWRLRLYVPYGTAWYPYFMRRLAERPANVLFLARNLLR